jgi:hypothetical protein
MANRKKKFSTHTEQALTRDAGDGTIAQGAAVFSGGKKAFGSGSITTSFGTGAKNLKR